MYKNTSIQIRTPKIKSNHGLNLTRLEITPHMEIPAILHPWSFAAPDFQQDKVYRESSTSTFLAERKASSCVSLRHSNEKTFFLWLRTVKVPVNHKEDTPLYLTKQRMTIFPREGILLLYVEGGIVLKYSLRHFGILVINHVFPASEYTLYSKMQKTNRFNLG